MNRLIYFFAAFALTIALFFVPFRILVFNQGFYSLEQKKLNVFEQVGENKTRNLTIEVINYLSKGSASLSEFTQREKDHLYDVRVLIEWALAIGSLSVLICIVLLYLSRKENISSVFVVSGAVSLSIIIIFSLLSLISFDFFFTVFHQIFFKPGTWTFNPEYEVIKQLFPNRFFFDFIVYNALAIAFLSVISMIFGMIYKKAFKQRKSLKRK
jgi:integral membrane protein (TIGR01906 family)